MGRWVGPFLASAELLCWAAGADADQEGTWFPVCPCTCWKVVWMAVAWALFAGGQKPLVCLLKNVISVPLIVDQHPPGARDLFMELSGPPCASSRAGAVLDSFELKGVLTVGVVSHLLCTTRKCPGHCTRRHLPAPASTRGLRAFNAHMRKGSQCGPAAPQKAAHHCCTKVRRATITTSDTDSDRDSV